MFIAAAWQTLKQIGPLSRNSSEFELAGDTQRTGHPSVVDLPIAEHGVFVEGTTRAVLQQHHHYKAEQYSLLLFLTTTASFQY